MANKFQSVRGFNDVLPPDTAAWQRLLALLETIDPADATAAIAGARLAFDAFRNAAAAQPVPRALELTP